MKRLYSYCLLILSPSLVFGTAHTPGDSTRYAGKDSVFMFSPQPIEMALLGEASDILYEYDGVASATGTMSNDSLQRQIDLARTVIQKVRDLGNWITNIDQATKVELPVGISRKIGGVSYDIAIHAVRLKPAYAEIDVFMQVDVPQGQTLTFMARSIKFTKKGGIVGDAKLELLGDYGINFNGDKVQLILKAGTFAVMDCDGFRELSLDAQVKFSRDLLRPENPDGSVGAGNVTADFKTQLTDWNDLVVQLSLPAFQVTGLNGVSFAVRDAVFDFSDLRNAPAVVFPEGYQTAAFADGNQNLWRGFYLRQLTVSLPPEFKTKGSTGRTSFAAENVLIDNLGVTGKFSGQNLISLQQGSMNGWAFSMETLFVELEANQLVEAGFSGDIVVPVGSSTSPFEYNAVINTGGNYLFNVSPTQDMTFPLWGAGKVEIYEASYLDIQIQDGRFLPRAVLHGRMNISPTPDGGGQAVSLADITFEDLQLQSVKPYLKIGNFSFGSEALQQKMAGFPVSIQDIGLRSLNDTQVGLDFTLKLNLVGEGSGAFAADAGLTVVGELRADEGWQSWKYKTINVREIGVDIDGGAFKIKGRLIFYKHDAMYGDGFNGTVQAEFTPGIKVTGTAIFGNVNEMRYWYADAMIKFPTGIPIFTGVGIFGFGGGAYYGMKMDNEGVGSELGRTASGVTYVPDTKAGLGLKAVVSIASHPKPEAFNGDMTFEIAFFKGGGVRYISFGGNGYLVTPGLDLDMGKMAKATNKLAGQVKKLEGQMAGATKGLLSSGGDENSFNELYGEIGEKAGSKGSISARVMISYDFENSVLHGNFEVFINVAGGLIQGIGAGGRAGWAVLHFAPKEWYVYAGTPDDRVGVALGVGSIRAQATSYFMVGTRILDSPPPPPEVARILGGGNYDYMSDLNSLADGGGFAFGASLSISTGDLQFLMFYAKFAAGLGFDIMLKDYGDTRCKGSDKRIGINGWYANGQSYAYFEGEIGIRVKVFGKKRSVSILEIGAAVLLQAQLPNPIWVQGTVGGYFRVLGGLVKGNCKFQVTLGNKCEIERSSNAILDDIKVIAELTPANGETNVNVFNTPQVIFNMPVDQPFELMDEGEIKRTFRVKLDHVKLTGAKTGAVAGILEWNEAHDVLAFNSYEVLPPKNEVKMSVQVSFEELKNGNWAAVVTDGVRVTEKMEQAFATGEAPDYIPHDNIVYSYPVIGQVNYYKDETREGYITLRKGQTYLFEPGPEWKQKGRFSAANGKVSYFDFAYSSGSKTVSYSTPSDLVAGQLYTFELVNLPAQQALAVDRNVSQVNNKVEGDAAVDMEVTTKKAEGTIESLQEKAVFTAYFRSSLYNTFLQKMSALTYSKGYSWMIANGIHELKVQLSGNELFDRFESGPSAEFDALVEWEATGSEPWFQNKVKPLVYDGYPILGQLRLTRRAIEPLGLPPFKGVHMDRQYDYTVPQEDASTMANPTFSDIPVLVYDLPEHMSIDYLDLMVQAANSSLSTSDPRINYLLSVPFPVLLFDHYSVKVRYVLPGTKKVTSEKQITIDYKY
ncbi:hypothetical protein [Dawidia soli]|uniref:Uncharacterized protein n=1 Tax=Dawidia soli TaxID=2782352 RepID=A0AAP2DBK8_9BACT|nr:hypothetical protein [Dawidia soli]MBT1688704.1 hypothetical protein [Dawidia soli]